MPVIESEDGARGSGKSAVVECRLEQWPCLAA